MNGRNCNIDYEVSTTDPWDAYVQFNSLLAESPYLSEEVIIEFINNPVFSSLMVKLLVIANPHAIENPEIMNALENRNPAMPQNYIDDIKNQVSTSSQLKVLEGNVATDYHLISNISEDIKRMYRADNENAWAKDSLINFVSRRPGLFDKYELATIYLSYGQYTDMQTVLDNIESNFEMDEAMEDDFNDFESLLNMAKTMNQNNLYEGGLSETEVSALEAILVDDQALTAPLALSLLKRNNPQYAFSEAVYDISQRSARMAHPATPKAIEDGEEAEFKLYPNPAVDFATLKYNCNYKELSYQIIGIDGRVLQTRQLESSDALEFKEVLIGLKDLSPGTYQLIVNSVGQSIWTGKLIITE